MGGEEEHQQSRLLTSFSQPEESEESVERTGN